MADFHTASGIRSNTRVPRQTVTRIVRRNAPRAEYTEEVDSLESTTRSAAKTTSLEGETADEWGDDVLSQSDAGGSEFKPLAKNTSALRFLLC